MSSARRPPRLRVGWRRWIGGLLGLGVSCGILVAPAEAGPGQVVVNEVHYHPGDDSGGGEFVEILNHGTDPVDIGGWILTGGVQFLIPEGTVLRPEDHALVVSDREAFLRRYDGSGATILGEFQGNLGNGGERVELWTGAAYLISFVDYSDSDPYPETPDGLGPSLERRSPRLEESDPRTWAASLLVGGTPGRRNSTWEEPPEPPMNVETVIPRGAVWRYLPGREEPPAGWVDPEFDDSGWDAGPAGFGYDDGDDSTLLEDMRGGYGTLYVRRSFPVDDPSSFRSLEFHVTYDDGYVAYLNGVEIGRSNTAEPPGTPPAHDATAVDPVEPPAEIAIDLTDRLDLLLPGVNTLAVQGLNIEVTNRDFSLHPWLSGRRDGLTIREETVVPAGATWRYLRGTEAPPPDWHAVGFDASAWDSGPSGLGYGDDDDATELAGMEGEYLTLFIRHEFTLDDVTDLAAVTLDVDYDDGFIAYLNGEEIARANVGDSAWDSTALGSHEAGEPEAFRPFGAAELLREGANVLAIQGHNGSLGSSDFSLAPTLTLRFEAHDGDDDPPDEPLLPAPRDLVINEVMPGGVGDGWIELFNPTDSVVDASGRRLLAYAPVPPTPVLPAGTLVPAGGFLVVDESWLGVEIEEVPVVILTLDDGRYVDALNPRRGSPGVSTGRYPDGSDNRRVLTTPTRDAPNEYEEERRVVIHEIMYRSLPDGPDLEFVELHNRSPEPVDLEGWAFTRGIDLAFEGGTSIPAGGYLVVARDPEAVEAHYAIEGVLGPYQGGLDNDAETLLLRDALDNQADRVRYADEGSWPESPDGTGPSIELIHPDLENRYGAAWAASDGDGTPGAPNSRFDPDPAPVAVHLEHAPAIPTPADSVHVTVTLSDETAILSARLLWARDGAGGPPESIAMADDGIEDDGVAGNGIWGASIPPRAAGDIVAYWVEATAAGDQVATAPAEAPDRTHLYQVEASPPEVERPLYRVIMTADALRTFRTRGTSSNTLLDATVVANGQAYHLRGIRLRGSSARRCDPLSYRIQFDHDTDLHGIKRVNVNGCQTDRQWIGLDILRRSGMPTPLAWFRRISFNGELMDGPHLHVEAIDDAFLERVFPDDPGGNLYRGRSQANLDYRGEDFGSYEDHYTKVTNETEADWSDVVELCSIFDASTTPDDEFPALVDLRVDTLQWTLFFATFAVLGSTENSILLNNGDDYFLYRSELENRWSLLPWDLDSCFNEPDQALFRPTVDQIERFLEHPFYAPAYWCHLNHLLTWIFTPELVDARIDHLGSLFSANRVESLRAYVPARRAYILSRLRESLTMQLDGGGAVCGDVVVPSGDTVWLSGEAPVCGTSEVRVAGETVTYDPLRGSWNGSASLGGLTALRIEAFDRDGRLVAREEYPVSGTVDPSPVPERITGRTVLDHEASPWRAAGEVTVEAGATLVVEPGVLLIMDASSSLVVDGTLRIEGAESHPVRVVSEVCDNDWDGIVLRTGASGSILSHCRLQNLRGVDGLAAGLVIDGAELALEDVLIDSSAADLVLVRGGGHLEATRCAFSASVGGLRFAGGGGEIRQCALRDIEGAAVRVEPEGGGPVLVESCTIEDCGAGVETEAPLTSISSVELRGISGAGISVAGARAQVDTCVVRETERAVAAADGARIEIDHVTIQDCGTALAAVEATPGAGGGEIEGHSLIVWGATTPVDADAASTISLSFSDVEGGLWPGPGNISEDPLFRRAAEGDLRLRAASPCRRTGRDGTDMGAIPYQPVGDVHRFLRCDTNGDGGHDISDAIRTLVILFAGGAPPPCEAAADCNGDRSFNLTDAVFHLAHLFQGGPPPSAPWPACEEAEVEECLQDTCIP